jgi:hypothetical protein
LAPEPPSEGDFAATQTEPVDKPEAPRKKPSSEPSDAKQSELRKQIHEQAKAVVKAIVGHRQNCQQAIKLIFNEKVLSRSILIELSSRLGEWDEACHSVKGYDPAIKYTQREDDKNHPDNRRRRFDVVKERGYLCVCFATLEEIFTAKKREENKALILREFYQFSPKPKENVGQLFKRFYDRVYEARLSGVDIEVNYQIVILLEALASYTDLTERIIQIKEEIELGMGVKTIAQLEESINDYMRIKKSSKAPPQRHQEQPSLKNAITGA